MAKFKAKLMQKEWRNTETFEIEANSIKSARQKAQDFIDENKDLEGVEHKLELERVEDPDTNDNQEGES